eukprot:10626418-Alexandrium_andersonii.AAC.1
MWTYTTPRSVASAERSLASAERLRCCTCESVELAVFALEKASARSRECSCGRGGRWRAEGGVRKERLGR